MRTDLLPKLFGGAFAKDFALMDAGDPTALWAKATPAEHLAILEALRKSLKDRLNIIDNLTASIAADFTEKPAVSNLVETIKARNADNSGRK